MSASAGDLEAAELVSIDKDVGQVILEDELDQIVTGGGMRPSVLIVIRQLVVEIAGICIRRIQTEGRIQRGDFREFDDQLGTRPADVRTIVLLARLDECTLQNPSVS